ncbi:MAG: hypothetical protein N2385_14255, partial [Chloroflexus sp.]|nr:hypothetical protein [Chloroflexus sp.]
LFPSDAMRATWREYVIPAWQRGDIARNAGMVLPLEGPASLLPLLALLMTGLIILLRPLEATERAAARHTAAQPPTTPIAPPAQR